MKTKYLIRTVTIFIGLNSIDWYLTASWKATAERGAWEMNFDFIRFSCYDFQEIFTMFCKSLLLNSYNNGARRA